jgi:uncharacterized protein (TIGR03067 family)
MRLLMVFSALVFACVLCLSASLARDAQNDLNLLQGEWQVIAMEDDAVRAAPEAVKGMRWKFDGATLEANDPGEELRPWSTIRLDGTKSPKQIDLVLTDGPNKGKSVPGIFMIERNRLVVCSGEKPTDQRPTEFATWDESSRCLLTLERAGK